MKKPVIIVIVAVIAIAIVLSLSLGGQSKLEVTHPVFESPIRKDSMNIKVFIENSGSMDGYMCDGSQLKDAVYDYVSDLNRISANTKLYYINSDTIPYTAKKLNADRNSHIGSDNKTFLKEYIKDLNPKSFKEFGGERKYTDLTNIFTTLLNQVNDSTVVIFVSDCILDLYTSDATKFLTNCEISIKDDFINARKRIPTLGVEILRLESDFDGIYYVPKMTYNKRTHEWEQNKEILDNKMRPYYIWIIGDQNYLARINSEYPLTGLIRHGLTHYVTFSSFTNVPYVVKNSTLTGNVAYPMKNAYNLTILADFKPTLLPDSLIEDISNYSFKNQDLRLEGVFPITSGDDKYTHFIKFTVPAEKGIIQDCLSLSMPKQPDWIEEFNDDTGDDIHKNIHKTTGIKYFVNGVGKAFNAETIATEFNFNFNYK